MSDNRYKELKKENNQKLETLTDTYKHIAHTYMLKARGYAENTLDTEARIKDVLDELVDFCEKGLPAPMAIPNMSEYIESKVVLLAKKNSKKEKVKSIIWTVLFIASILLVIGFGLWLRSENYLKKPKNIEHSVTGNEITISWDVEKYASEGYTIYYDDEKNKVTVEQPESADRVSYTFNLDPSKEYTFYIYANQVTNNNNESAVIIYYGSEVAEYIYTPGE